MTLSIGMTALFVLLAIRMPVGIAMAAAGVLGLYLVGGPGMVEGILATAPLSVVSPYELITIPMFLLMAELVLLSGIADDLFRATAAWVGRVPGGLGMATALAGAGFGAICCQTALDVDPRLERPKMTPRSGEAVSRRSLYLRGFQTSWGVVERLGSDGAARGVAGSVTGAAAHARPCRARPARRPRRELGRFQAVA